MMAKEYGVPPWEIEESGTLEWFRNWLTIKTAEAQELKRLRDKADKHGR